MSDWIDGVARRLLRGDCMQLGSFVTASTFVSVLLLGAASPAHAYTIKRASSGQRVRWHEGEVPLEFGYIGARTVPRADLEDALRRAARTWSEVPGAPHLSVRKADGGPISWGHDGVNGVYVLETWPFPDRRLAVTVSTLVEGTGELLDTDILVNGEMPFDMLTEDHRPDDRYDLGLVLTHELGHVLGLDESARREATMWPDIRAGEMRRRELAADDVDGVTELYGAASPGDYTITSWGCAASPGGSRSSPLGLAGLLGTLSLLLLGSRHKPHAGSARTGLLPPT